MGSIVMGRRPKLKTVVVPRQKYPEACVWQPTSNLLVLFKFFVGYSFLVSRPNIRSCLVNRNCWDSGTIHQGCPDDGVAPNQLAWDENSGQWICGDKDTNCANYGDGNCDNAGIHRACQDPQTPIYSGQNNEWRCAWPNMDDWH